MSFVRVFLLRLRELFATPALVVALAILPIALGLVAGASNLNNQQQSGRIAVTDMDNSPVSRELLASLTRQNWEIIEATPEEAARLVDGKRVDGALTIQPGFSRQLGNLSGEGLTYVPTEGSLTTNLVLDAVTLSVIPFKSNAVFFQQASALYAAFKVPLPEGFAETFEARSALHREGGAKQEFAFVGEFAEPSALTYVVSDYSMEVLFLGFLALLGTFSLDALSRRRRLLASPNGLAYDYGASTLALFVAGCAQIVLYVVSMRVLMREAVNPNELLILAAFLLLCLALSRALALLHEGIRLYLGLMLLLLLSLAGGCFLQLPEPLLRSLGQYVPHGWALAALRGYPVLPPIIAAGLALLFLLALYPLHARRSRRLRAV